MLRISPPGPAPKSPPDEPPLLSLTHFSRAPFVNFGCVRPGSVRSASLLLHNPNPEPASLAVFKLPKNRGFSIVETESVIPPFETITLTITWTPLEEGNVREIVTFIVNDVVKHQAVLLGRAELPAKKKRNTWNTIKMKSNPIGPKVPVRRQKEVDMTSKTRKSQVTKREKCGQLERARSPLQSCENLAHPLCSPSPMREIRLSTENRVPVLTISPVSNELQPFTPGSLKRSKTYSVLCTVEYSESTEVATMSKYYTDIQVEEEWTLKAHKLNKESMSPINSVHGHTHNVTHTPDFLMESALNSLLSPTAFCNQGPVQIDAHSSVLTEEQITQEKFNLASSKIPSPASPMVTPKRKFLSPNSFLSNSFVPEEYFSVGEHTPILSPEQFVRENCLASQSESLVNGPMLSKSWQTASHNSSKSSSSSAIQDVQVSGGPVEQEISSPIMEVPRLNSRLTYCVKKTKQSITFPVEHDQNIVKEPKKPCVFSATVTKLKAEDRKEKPKGQLLKSRRKLDNTTPEHKSSVTFSNIVLQDLPVISVPCPSDCSSDGSSRGTSICKSTVLNRKRKSEEFLGTNAVMETELSTVPQVKKTHLSKPDGSHVSYKEKLSQKKQVVTQVLKSEKTLKARHSAVNGKHTILKAQSVSVGPPKQKMAVTFKNSKRVVAVPQSKLVFTQTSKTVIPRHPMPFAAKNMFYDERWMAKQERGFTWWLNFILTPDDFAVKRDSSKVQAATLILGSENAHKVSVPRAPTKEEVSLKAYTTRCKLNRLRRSACRLFTSEPVVKAILRLEVEIEAQRLLVRRDRHLWKDIGERQKILNWLLSYNPLWLRIGLETIFGELISLESNSDVTGLAVFILNRLLWNPDIAAEYRHPSVPNLYRDGHEEALSKFTLKKLLLLIFFLDHAKQFRLIDHDPCLFWKDAEYKTSKDLLLAFSRDFLSGEGDLSRHLGYLGLPVSHVQTPLDEFDFAVTNLAVDLQCGVRLVRTVELLAQSWSLSKKLRVPAISRLQKMHNVEVALQALTDRGVLLKDERGVSITSKDIVDRHRERTLALLWKIVFSFQVDVLLSTKQLKEEIQILKESYNTQKQLAALRSLANPAPTQTRESDQFEPEKYNERVSLLMEWVNAVCRFYSTKVQNFTVSFSDGRVFCYLVNHYHPSYLPLNAVCQRTTQTVECSQSGTAMLNSSDSDNSLEVWPGVFDQGVTSSALYKELLKNEQTNFSLVHAAVADLGGIPAMVHHSDMSNTIPDEKVVITFLSFLCARLLDLRKETRAARVIQTVWRNYRLKVEKKLLERKHKAARVIQRAVVQFLSCCRLQKRSHSAAVIQKYFRRYLAQRQLKELKALKHKELQDNATLIIQRFWKGYSARRRFIILRHSAICMQARVRAKIAQSSYKQIQQATVTLQSHMRAWLLGKKKRQEYLHIKSSVIIIQHAFTRWKRQKQKRHTEAVLIIQKCYRRWKACKSMAQNMAAIKIQSVYRMHRERQKFLDTKCKIIKIQSWFRCKKDREAFLMQKESILTLQKYYRAYKQGRLDRKKFLEMRSAAISIQAHYRGMRVRQLYYRIKAACVLQSYWRMRQEKKKYDHVKQLVVLLQSNVRKCQQQKQFKLMKRAACVIQTYYRSHRATKQAVHRFKQMRHAAVVIQSAFRRMQARKAKLQVRSAVKIQALSRSYFARKRFLEIKRASIKIQSAFRMRQRRVRYCALRKATFFVQQKFRAKKQMQKEREAYINMQVACIKVQAAVRGHFVRREIQSWHKAATILQAEYRMWRQKKQYKLLYRAAIIIQEHYRAHKMQVHQRAYFLAIKQSAVRLQAAYRGYTVRKSVKTQRLAALHIQTAFRSYRIRKNYLRMRQSVVTIQRWYRCKTSGRKEQKKYLEIQRATVTVQSAYRGWVTRKQVKVWNTAAICIQSAFRRYAAQKQIRTMKKAALTIQQRYRAVLAGRRERERYLKLCMSAKRVQAMWRGRAVRKDLERQHKSAALIQSFYRMHVCQTQYKAMRRASQLIQNFYRAHKLGQLQQFYYLRLKKCATVLQSAYRGWKVRRQMHSFHKAATTIQSAFRSFILHKRYHTLRTATLTIQRHYSAFLCARLQRTKYVRVRKSVIVLQSAFRSFMVRKRILRMQQSAIVVQRNYRALLTGRRVRKQYLELHRATCMLQAAWRGRKVRRNIKAMDKAATVIQSQYRMMRQRCYYRELREAARVVQLRYRASKERDRNVHQYMAIRNAALCIQSAFRGLKVRRDLNAKHAAAALIQRHYKCFLERRRFVLLRNATILTQQRFRMKVHAEQIRQQYLRLKKAVVVLQTAFRGWKERERINHMHYSATVIQAAFRMHKAKDSYHTLRHAAIVIQQRYKANMASKSERKTYLKQRQSAVTIQATFRGMKERKMLSIMHKAASTIQASFRMHQCRSQYIKVQWAVHVIQQRFRANKLRDSEKLQYHVIKRAVLCIQSCYHGFKVRKDLEFQHRMATRIQSAYKMHRRRVVYKNMQSAVSLIQTWYRSIATCRQTRAEFLQLRKATILIQAACRGTLVRRNIKAMHSAATCIQSFYRMYSQRKYYIMYLQAVCTIQQQYRAKKARDHYFNFYQNSRKAATLLQAGFRGMKTRIWIQQMHQAAATIQQAFKSFKERKSYLELKASTILIQRQYRASVLGRAERQKFLKCRSAAICIQAAYRGLREREELKLRHRAAAQIQSLFRMHRQHVSYLANKQAAVVIQRHYRRYRSCKLEHKQYLKLCNAAIIVQALYRGKKSRKNLRDMHNAATVVQAYYRMHRQRQYYFALQHAVRTTQVRFRANRARVDAVKKYATIRMAVKRIQSAFRARKAARDAEKDSAAIVIQAQWKMHTVRREYVKMTEAAVVIQAVFRGHRTRKMLKAMEVSACLIQAWYRSCRLTRLQRAQYLSIRSAAITIQSAFRGMLARRVAEREQAASKVRSFLVMTPYRKRFLRLRAAAIVLQSHYRMQRIKRAYEMQRETALILHRCSKTHVPMKYQKENELENGTHTNIQAYGTMFSSVNYVVIKIQAQWRGYIQRRKFVQYKSAALLIQQRYRAYRLQKSQHRQKLQEQKAAIVIQAAYRGFKIRKHFVRLKQAVVTLQMHFRAVKTGRYERIRYTQSRNAVIKLQACARGWLVRKENRMQRLMKIAYTLHIHLCAIKIQRRFKAHLALKRAEKHVSNIIFIQMWYRAKLQRRYYLHYRQKIVTLQRAIRAWLQLRNNAACKIQRSMRDYLQRRRQARAVSGIVKFQALWRGYICRKARDTKAVRVLRKRLQRVSQDVKEEDKLCNRTVVALDYLLSSKHLSFILAALQHLEVATRLSAVCCENMAQSGAVKTIFVLIRSCNRSIPCMEVIKLSVMVLLNLSKYERTVQAVYEVENSVDILLDLMQIFREKAGDKVSDKGGSIFTKTCCLMAIFALHSQRAKVGNSIHNIISQHPGVISNSSCVFQANGFIYITASDNYLCVCVYVCRMPFCLVFCFSVLILTPIPQILRLEQ
ncbi:hypothetical protein XENTR_v10012280 [Xenopus tropicalis]|nr:hypothetical protein XENTR_v10012280 [Xenopus tropicalis]